MVRLLPLLLWLPLVSCSRSTLRQDVLNIQVSPGKDLSVDMQSASVDAQSDWELISKTRACKRNGNPDTDMIAALDINLGTLSLDGCKLACSEEANCAAIDWFKESHECLLYPRACTEPQYKKEGASSWVMSQTVLKRRACESWSPAMEWLGKGWINTDMPAEKLAEVFDGAFRGKCKKGDTIDVFYAERDVGYYDGGGLVNYFKNIVLRHVNVFKLFHSGVRLIGCGTSLMLQLQANAWGFTGSPGVTPFGVAFPYPFTSPDNRQVWTNLFCDKGKGIRDVGAGNSIFYRINAASKITEWARGEKKIVSLTANDVKEFTAGIAKYLSWWNVKSQYFPERLSWKNDKSSDAHLLRPQLVCDTFSLWLWLQALAFAKTRNYGQHMFHIDPEKDAKFNFLAITILDHGGKNRPQMGDLATISSTPVMRDFDLLLGFARTKGPRGAADVMFSETTKAFGKCRKIDSASEKKKLLGRHWKNPREWSQAWLPPSLDVNFSMPVMDAEIEDSYWYPCTDRVRMPTGETDMVRWGLWRFFRAGIAAAGKGEDIVALEWDTEAHASYEKPFPVFAPNKAVQLPEGTPREPFGEDAPPNPCGTMCPWEYPVPAPHVGGYAL